MKLTHIGDPLTFPVAPKLDFPPPNALVYDQTCKTDSPSISLSCTLCLLLINSVLSR